MSPDRGLPEPARDEGAAGHPSAAPSAARDAVSVVGVRKVYGVTRALDACSFSARRGEIHAIVGGNGCGKSTLAKVMSAVVLPDSGQLSIFGLTPRTPIEARRAGVATVFQEVLVADECSVADNLFVGSDRLFTKTRPTQEKLDTARTLMAELTGLAIDPEMQVGGLPLSIKQWITIGRALLMRPRMLILDESSAALDFDSTERLFDRMRALRDEGATVIIVTHRIAELIRISDRATVMRDGRDVGVLEKEEITEKNLLSLMTGDRDSAGAGNGEAHRALSDEIVLRTNGLRIWPEAEGIHFDLLRGEIVGVAGLDGQGQDELVRALAGVEPALEGLPRARDEAGELVEVTGLPAAETCRVTYVSGDRRREGVFPNLSIFENFVIPLYRKRGENGRLGVVMWAKLSAIYDWFVERLSIKAGRRSNRITSLSGGNQQKVLLGRAFAQQPHILVLNDPARGIDVETKRELYRHLRDFASQGHSVVFLSSELEEFIGLCSRVIVIRHGALFESFGETEIDPDRILEAMFGHGGGREARGPAESPRGAETTAGASAEIVDFDRGKQKARERARTQVRARATVGRIRIVDRDAEQARGIEGDPEARRERDGSGIPAAARPIKILRFDD